MLHMLSHDASLRQQIGLKINEFLRHRGALLLTTHEGGKAGGYLYGLTGDALDGVLELGGMGGLEEETDFARTETFL